MRKVAECCMMRSIEIPYGHGKQMLHVDDGRLKAVLSPNYGEIPARSPRDIVRDALEHPIGAPRLRKLAEGKHRILVITSDHTRPVPSAVTMPLLLEEIRGGNPDAQITLLVATGMHRPTTETELRAKFGEKIAEEENIVIHRATETEEMAFFGILPSGGELWLNRLVKEADLVVSEGFIEPHFFAGFSGGRKSILPGIASEKTILYNHNAGFIASAHARAGCLDNNPIHQDMLYAADQARLAFILNVLLDTEKHILAAVAGHPEKAHRAGCVLCEKLTRVQPVQSDIAITSNGGYPLDQNVYQSVKGMTAAESCVRAGGAIIACAALGDGHGGEAFYRWFADRKDPNAVAKAIQNVSAENTSMDQWEAQILARVMQKARCWFVTGEENRELIQSMHLLWAPDVDTALAEATALLGEKATVTVIPDGVSVIA